MVFSTSKPTRIIRQDDRLVNLLYKSVIKDFLELTPGATEESLIKLIKDKVDSYSSNRGTFSMLCFILCSSRKLSEEKATIQNADMNEIV